MPIDKQQLDKTCCSDSDRTHVLLRELLQGNFVTALLLPEAQQWLRPDTEQTKSSVAAYFEHINQRTVQQQSVTARWHQLQTAVACFLLFLQVNLTGCVTPTDSIVLLLALLLLCDCNSKLTIVCRPPQTCSVSPSELSAAPCADSDNRPAPAQQAMGQDSTTNDDRWALQQLAADGEEVVGRIHLPQYLLLARTLLIAPLGRSLCIWTTVC